MTHRRSAAVAYRSRCRAGSATFTTVPSMNARLDPRMVAARIQRPRRAGTAAAHGWDRMTPSSHGGLAMVTISPPLAHDLTPLSYRYADAHRGTTGALVVSCTHRRR